MSRRDIFIAIACILAIVGAGTFIYLTQFTTRTANEILHVGIGQAMAEETAKVLNGKGTVLVIDMESIKGPGA